ncbi:hypothetical protein NLU13_5984 [Sarocladium strictum]|uniref:Protein kinase domain-containing protein n=1 Tax=Sarocladium strictum TaxID=5046 RepID=A0AA39L6Q0_SARSR|nr:hypothetical protein NLU13_5984 [Sarocladium strictum]
MVQLSLLLLAAAASLSVASPVKLEKSKTLVARSAPNPGDVLTMKKTNNNPDDGTYEEGDEVTFTVGNMVGEGSAGRIYDIDCGEDNSACSDLGSVVVKYYLDNDQRDDERRHLAKIDELKAVLSQDGDEFTLLTKWEGSNLTKLPKWAELQEDTAANKDAINHLVDTAIDKIVEDASNYIRDHLIFHDDMGEANTLLMEADGEITSAKLIDWDKASILSEDNVEEALEALRGVVEGYYNGYYVE